MVLRGPIASGLRGDHFCERVGRVVPSAGYGIGRTACSGLVGRTTDRVRWNLLRDIPSRKKRLGPSNQFITCKASSRSIAGQRLQKTVVKLNPFVERILPDALIFAVGAGISALDRVTGDAIGWHPRRIGIHAI